MGGVIHALNEVGVEWQDVLGTGGTVGVIDVTKGRGGPKKGGVELIRNGGTSRWGGHGAGWVCGFETGRGGSMRKWRGRGSGTGKPLSGYGEGGPLEGTPSWYWGLEGRGTRSLKKEEGNTKGWGLMLKARGRVGGWGVGTGGSRKIDDRGTDSRGVEESHIGVGVYTKGDIGVGWVQGG
eukprot:764476-Hanusia_phi.AAC.1